MSQLPPADRGAFAGDELYFTGFDLGSARRLGYEDQDHVQDFARPEDDYYEFERRRYEAYVTAMQEREEELVRSAQDRLRKAKGKGRSRPSLTQEEMDALERQRIYQQRQRSPTESRTPGKDRSSSSSAVNHDSDKGRRKSSGRLFGFPAANS